MSQKTLAVEAEWKLNGRFDWLRCSVMFYMDNFSAYLLIFFDFSLLVNYCCLTNRAKTQWFKITNSNYEQEFWSG